MPKDNLQPEIQSSKSPVLNSNGQIVQPLPSEAPPNTSSYQPTAVVYGQVIQQSEPVSFNQFEQISDQKPSKWRYFFIVLGILQAVGIALFVLIMTWAIQQAKAGKSGTELSV